MWLLRVAPDGSRRAFTQADLGLTSDAWFGNRVFVAADGTVWVDYGARGPDEKVWSGLAAYDGTDWRLVSFDVPVDGEPRWAVGPDDTIWMASLLDPEAGMRGRRRAEHGFWSWSDDGWTYHGSALLWWDALGDDADVHAIELGPDGRVWFDPLTFFDGTALRQILLPSSESNQQPILSRYGFDASGTSWLIVLDAVTPEELGCPERRECRGASDGLYAITPEALGTATVVGQRDQSDGADAADSQDDGGG
jgi:hypothetical protein